VRCWPQHPHDPQAVEDFLASFMATTVSVWNAFLNRTILVGSIKPNIYENLGFFRGDYLSSLSLSAKPILPSVIGIDAIVISP
jgi:hypothetical protein